MGVFQTIPGTLSGPNVSKLPLLAASSIPSAGVPGYGYRFRAESLPLALDAPVTSWPSVDGSVPLTVPSGRTAPVLKGQGSRRFVKGDGVNNVLQNAAGSMVGQRTIALVARVADTVNTLGHDIFSLAASVDIGMSKSSASTTYTAFLPGTASRAFSDGTLGQWRFLAVTFTATEAVMYVDGNATPAISAGLTAAMLDSLRLFYVNSPAPGNVEIAELITWPTALSAADIATVRAALITAQAGLLS